MVNWLEARSQEVLMHLPLHLYLTLCMILGKSLPSALQAFWTKQGNNSTIAYW